MTLARVALIAAFTTLVSGLAASAQDAGAPASESPSTGATPAQDAAMTELTAEERAEKQARKACKIKICDILATKDPQGDDVSCDIVKTWRESDITKMLGGRFDWPWGKAVCQSKLDIKREQLVNAMTQANYEVALPEQKVSCALAQKSEGEPYAVGVSIAPKVTFENGKDRVGAAQLGRSQRADARLCPDLCRHGVRQFDQRTWPRGGAHGERVHREEMQEGQERPAEPHGVPTAVI
jgi:hypothetical protein